jgi:predicted DNA-binding transcriptional regulator AlpA
MRGAQVTPRLMTKAEAAAYCAVTPSRFYQLVRAGTLPGPVPGTTRYDRVAIDRALDKHAGLTAEAELSPLQEWLAKDGNRAA